MKRVAIVIPETKVLLLLPQEVEIFNIAKRLERDFPHIEINACEPEIASAISQIKEIQPHYVIYAIHHFTGDKSILEYELRMGDFTIINVVLEKDFKVISDKRKKKHFLKEPVDIDELMDLLENLMAEEVINKSHHIIMNHAGILNNGKDAPGNMAMINDPQCLWMRKLNLISGTSDRKIVHCKFMNHITGDSALCISKLLLIMNPKAIFLIDRFNIINTDRVIDYDREDGTWAQMIDDDERKSVTKERQPNFLYFMRMYWFGNK
jgi:hypothetical protein